MSDAGGEFTSNKLKEVLIEQDIKIYQSIPHMPQQNGHAECFNWTYMEKQKQCIIMLACPGPGGNSV